MRIFKISFYTLFLINFSFSDVISQSSAINIAENFFYSKNQRDLVDFSYNESTLINYNNEDIFYAIKLNPRGFILIAADDLIMPILGYSFENEFVISLEYPSNINYLFNLYSSELSSEKIVNIQRDDVARFILE